MSPLLRLAEATRLPSCDSTQQVCRRRAAEGAPEGTIVVADTQTGGRGREDRTWHSPAGAGLYTSFLLRPRLDPAAWLLLTPLVALALAEALEGLRGPHGAADHIYRMMIKWPNDLSGAGGKVAGVLAETEGKSVVVGLGVNLRQRREDFAEEIRDRASSLKIEGFDPVPDRETVLRAFDEVLSRYYARAQQGDTAYLRPGLLERFHLGGKHVRIGGPGMTVIEGIARELGPFGELILETRDGLHTVISGEIIRIGSAEEPRPGSGDPAA